MYPNMSGKIATVSHQKQQAMLLEHHHPLNREMGLVGRNHMHSISQSNSDSAGTRLQQSSFQQSQVLGGTSSNIFSNQQMST